MPRHPSAQGPLPVFSPELIYRPGAGELDLDYLLLFLNRGEAFNPKVTVDHDTSRMILRLIDETAQELMSEGIFYRISVKNQLCQSLPMLNWAAEVSSDNVGDQLVRLRDIEDEHSITWVAYEVGFESHSCFDRIFHQVTKLTPQEFRKRFAAKAPVAK